jgi:hypothetical protein
MNPIQSIDNVPKELYHKKHYYCDYVEILALINNQDIVSVSDIYDRFKENKDIETINNEEVEDNIPSDEKWNSRIKEWLDNIAVRDRVFDDFYPFIIKNNNIQLKDDLTNAHKLYIFLLLSSSQKYIPKQGNPLQS